MELTATVRTRPVSRHKSTWFARWLLQPSECSVLPWAQWSYKRDLRLAPALKELIASTGWQSSQAKQSVGQCPEKSGAS